MTTISQLLKQKGHGYFAIGPEDTVYTAIRIMADEDIGSLLVVENGLLVGMFTERDYAREVALKGKTSPSTRVSEVMSTDIVCVGPQETVETCMGLMTRERIRHLPATDGETIIGIVSIGDLVKSIIDEQRHTIDLLEGYIHGELYMH